jgi:phosphate-selective porin OprO and OprP
MNNSGRVCQVLLVLTFMIVLGSQSQAQNHVTRMETTQRQGESHKDPEAPYEVDLLKIRVEQLQSLVEQQQRILAAMEKRLKEVEERSPSTNALAGNSAAASETRPSASETAQRALGKTASVNQPAAKSPAVEAKPLAGWNGEHVYLQNADGDFSMQVTGSGQFDFRGYQAGNHPPNSFLARRVRLGVEGKIARYFEYKVGADLADTRNTVLRDLFIGIHRIDELQLRFGQFKEPFSQEEMLAHFNLDFVERSLVNNLVPSRSPGLMAFGVINKGKFEYQVGAFNAKGLLAANTSNQPEGVVRLRFAPWKNENHFWLKGLAFGGAYAQGRNRNGLSVLGQTESRSAIFYTPEIINGKVLRANGELTWTLGSAAIRAEYIQTNQERKDLGDNRTSLPGVVAKGLMSQFTYVLTGEKKAESGAVIPNERLFENGFGAWELKARYAKLQIADGSAKSNDAQSVYVGTNWYLNRYVRYLFDLGLERFNDPLRSPKPADKNYFVVLSRIQLVF